MPVNVTRVLRMCAACAAQNTWTDEHKRMFYSQQQKWSAWNSITIAHLFMYIYKQIFRAVHSYIHHSSSNIHHSSNLCTVKRRSRESKRNVPSMGMRCKGLMRSGRVCSLTLAHALLWFLMLHYALLCSLMLPCALLCSLMISYA